MKYKALICDIDGTLLPKTPRPIIAVKDRLALQKASKFLKVSIATARPYQKNKPFFDSLSITAPIIVSNGAQIVDSRTGKFLKEYPMEYAVVKNVCTVLTTYPVKFWIQDNGRDRKWKNYHPDKPLVIVVSQLSNKYADELMHKLSKISGISISKSEPEQNNTADLLITHPMGTKQHAVITLCHILGLSRGEVIGIGDDYNDISFLTSVGLKVAMGNAIEEVKDLADYIAPSVWHGGVANVVDMFVLE